MGVYDEVLRIAIKLDTEELMVDRYGVTAVPPHLMELYQLPQSLILCLCVKTLRVTPCVDCPGGLCPIVLFVHPIFSIDTGEAVF